MPRVVQFLVPLTLATVLGCHDRLPTDVGPGPGPDVRPQLALGNGPVSLVAPLVATYPLLTVPLSMLILGRAEIGTRLVAGTALTVVGVIGSPMRRPRKKRALPAGQQTGLFEEGDAK